MTFGSFQSSFHVFGTPRAVLAAAALLASVSASAADPVVVELDTSKGKIVLELDAEKAPQTVENFLKYVENEHYAGTIFHRVIETFMIQGGGFDADLKEKKNLPPVRNEAGNGLRNLKYTVAMARTPNPHSATSQFFINTADNGFLNRAEAADGFGYTVFGKVIEGKQVVDEIAAVKTHSRPNPAYPASLMTDVPVEPVTIKGVKRIK